MSLTDAAAECRYRALLANARASFRERDRLDATADLLDALAMPVRIVDGRLDASHIATARDALAAAILRERP